MIYGDNPEDILLGNRTRTLTIEQAQAQINSLARMLVDVRNRCTQLESEVVTLPATCWSQPSRSLNTDFTVHDTKNAWVFYTLELTVTGLITGTDNIAVSLFTDGLVTTMVKKLLTVTLALGVMITQTQQVILSAFVPAGKSINLTTSGTGIATLVNVLEVLV